MTTTARPAAHPAALALPGLGLGLAWVTSTGFAAMLVALVVGEGPGAEFYGALVGSALLIGFFAFGGVVVSVVSSLAPRGSLLVALTTYVLQVAALALVYVELHRSGLLGERIDARWVSVTLIAGALAWSTALVVGSLRGRHLIYDLPEAADDGSRAEVSGR